MPMIYLVSRQLSLHWLVVSDQYWYGLLGVCHIFSPHCIHPPGVCNRESLKFTCIRVEKEGVDFGEHLCGTTAPAVRDQISSDGLIRPFPIDYNEDLLLMFPRFVKNEGRLAILVHALCLGQGFCCTRKRTPRETISSGSELLALSECTEFCRLPRKWLTLLGQKKTTHLP